MIALCVLLFAAVAFAGISQPTTGLSVQQRDGRQAQVRFISQLTNLAGQNINLNGFAYTNQPAEVTIKVGTTTIVRTETVAQGATTAYAEIDTGNNGQATVSLQFNVATAQTVNCATPISKNDRVTYVLTQSVSAATPISTGTCTLGAGSCNALTGGTNAGSVTITCTAVIESLTSVGRTCSTVPVRFFNLHTGCPTLKYQLSVTAGVSETLDLSKTIPTTFGTSSHEQLERSISRSIGGVPLIHSTTAAARFIDAFIDSSGILTSVQTLETGFLNVVNLAYRENGGVRDNDFVVVISQSATITGQLSEVVHFQLISAANSLSGGWIEVPTGSYFLHVYDNGDSEAAIFGDNTLASPTAATATALVVSSAVTIAANDVKIFRISNSGSTAPLLAASLTVDAVPLNTNGVAADTTRHVIWNNVLSSSLKLAAPDNECCNFIKETDNDEIFSHPPTGTPDTNNLTPDTLTGSFSVYQSSSVCTALGSPIVSDTVSLTDSTGSSECADQGIFVFARPVTVTSQTCTSTSTGVSTCSAGVSGTATSTVFASTTGVPSDTNPTGNIDLSLTVPFCDCTPPPTACTPSLTCEEQAQVDLITAAITSSASSVTSTITSAVSSSTTSIQTTVQAVNNTFITNIDDNNAGIDIALAAIASTNNTLHVQLGKVQTTQAEHTTTLSSLQRKVLREINGVEDDIEDVADDIDDIAKAVDA